MIATEHSGTRWGDHTAARSFLSSGSYSRLLELPLPLPLALTLILPASAADLRGPARVIDGDTIEVAGQRVRLHGIDAPEHRQPCIKDGCAWACGEAATDALRAFVSGQALLLHSQCRAQRSASPQRQSAR